MLHARNKWLALEGRTDRSMVRPMSLRRPALSAILVFELAPDQVEAASEVILTTMAGAAMPAVHLKVPLDVEIGTGASWGAAH